MPLPYSKRLAAQVNVPAGLTLWPDSPRLHTYLRGEVDRRHVACRFRRFFVVGAINPGQVA